MSLPVHHAYSSPRFSSRINIVPDDQFHALGITQLAQQGLTSDSPWQSDDRVSFTTKAATVGAYICNAGGFQNGKHMTLFHLCPYGWLWDDQLTGNGTEETWMDVADALADDIQALKKENPNLRAFLTGGVEKDKDSRQLKEHLLELFEDFGIPVSIIWGSRSKENLHYDIQTDTWTVSSSNIPAPTPEGVKQAFQSIHIDPGDELFIDGKKVSQKELEEKTT